MPLMWMINLISSQENLILDNVQPVETMELVNWFLGSMMGSLEINRKDTVDPA